MFFLVSLPSLSHLKGVFKKSQLNIDNIVTIIISLCRKLHEGFQEELFKYRSHSQKNQNYMKKPCTYEAAFVQNYMSSFQKTAENSDFIQGL